MPRGNAAPDVVLDDDGGPLRRFRSRRRTATGNRTPTPGGLGCPASGRKRIIAMRERKKSKAMRARKPGSEVERPARAQGGWGDKRTAECMYVRRGFLRDSRSSQGLEVPKFHLAHPTPFGQVLRYEKTQGWCPAARGASAFVSRYRMGII